MTINSLNLNYVIDTIFGTSRDHAIFRPTIPFVHTSNQIQVVLRHLGRDMSNNGYSYREMSVDPLPQMLKQAVSNKKNKNVD